MIKKTAIFAAKAVLLAAALSTAAPVHSQVNGCIASPTGCSGFTGTDTNGCQYRAVGTGGSQSQCCKDPDKDGCYHKVTCAYKTFDYYWSNCPAAADNGAFVGNCIQATGCRVNTPLVTCAGNCGG